MKTVIVVDVPVGEDEIRQVGFLAHVSVFPSVASEQYYEFENVVVRPLPEKLKDWQYADKYNRWGVSQKDIQKEIIGYNLCIDEITGENE